MKPRDRLVLVSPTLQEALQVSCLVVELMEEELVDQSSQEDKDKHPSDCTGPHPLHIP